MLEDKLRECFEDMVVFKDLKKSNFFSALSLPSFLRENFRMKREITIRKKLPTSCIPSFPRKTIG